MCMYMYVCVFVIIIIIIADPSTKRGKALIVLCQQEILAFDLEAPK